MRPQCVSLNTARCIDCYIEQQNKAANGDKVDTDKRLVAIVERMFERYVVLETPWHAHMG